MKRILFSLLVFFALHASAGVGLVRQGSAVQLEVDGQRMLLLAGELSNSAATSTADIDSAMARVARMGLNSVFVPAYWEFIEPEEGLYDFTLVDRVVDRARAHDMKVVFLWFGAWKNSMSCYAPLWVKTDTRRFPRALTAEGKPMEICSAFSTELLAADKRAFCQLMSHIKATDSQQSTVVMVQVENEIGMLESARDHSALAQKVWQGRVPAEIAKVLKVSSKQTWEEAVGGDAYGEEKFQAYYYARYVEQLAQAAKAIHPLPLYVNAAMNSRGRRPGEYPSAGPLAHLMQIWKTAAPSIDIYAPDIYDTDFKGWVSQYKRQDNPFFTPEVHLGDYSGVRALYTFGETDAMSFSPFAIDQASPSASREVAGGYALLRQLMPLLVKAQGQMKVSTDYTKTPPTTKMTQRNAWGLLMDQKERERIVEDDGVVITARHYFTLPWDPRATSGEAWPEGGGLILRLAKNDYLIAGNGIVATFQTPYEKIQADAQKVVRGEDGFVEQGAGDAAAQKQRFNGKRLGLASVDQVEVDAQGNLIFIRRDNGDQDHQGRHARISCGEYKILRVKLYEY